jgi:flagellar basal-body rod protein FlgG
MRALYVAASGMTAQQTRIDTIANNIANVGTTGYKKSREAFQDLFYQELNFGGVGQTSARVEAGGGVRLAAIEKSHVQGSMNATGNPFHAAIHGKGFFAVEDVNGEQFYTRDGTFTRDSDGTLITQSGLTVVGDIAIPMDADNFEILTDGTVRALLTGDTEYTTLGQMEIANFVNPTGLRSAGGNLYQETPESGEPIPIEPGEDNAQIMQGYLEGSNVDVAEELINLIMAQRSYELTSKVVQASDEALDVATNLRR